MNPQSVLQSLKELCRDIDAGRPMRRISLRQLVLPLAIPAAMGLAAAPIGCGSHTAVEETNCSDGVDNDDDGDIDCNDEDCRDSPDCALPPYGIPWEEPAECDDNLDNDDDGFADCLDSDCADLEVCDEICDDGIDNDDDLYVDCEDEECFGHPGCDAPLYAGPFA